MRQPMRAAAQVLVYRKVMFLQSVRKSLRFLYENTVQVHCSESVLSPEGRLIFLNPPDNS